MNRKSILEKLFYSEMAEHCESMSDDEEGELRRKKLIDEIKKFIPDNYDVEVAFHFLIDACIASNSITAFKKGVSFATAFMSEALQPTPKTHDDFNKSLNSLLK